MESNIYEDGKKVFVDFIALFAILINPAEHAVQVLPEICCIISSSLQNEVLE